MLDARKQSESIASEMGNYLRGRRFKQLEGSVAQARKHLGSLFPFLTRPERRLAEHELRLWSTVAERIRARPDETAIVTTPQDARDLLQEISGLLRQLLERGEFILLDVCVPVQADLLAHVHEETKRWGVGGPPIRISPARPAYAFTADTEHILLEIQNSAVAHIDHALVALKAETGVQLLPDSFEVRGLEPGDVVRQEVRASIPSHFR